MFTGIVEESGTVRQIRRTASGVRLTVKTKKTHLETGIGSSLSVDGVCLTMVQKKGRALTFDVSKNSLRLTTLGDLRKGNTVNLERPLKLGCRIGGHFVQGHVDGVGVIRNRKREGKNLVYQIHCPPPLRTYLIPRGSIAIDGISLTLADIHQDSFKLYLIPHTLYVTGLAKKGVGDKVNIEVDLLSKLLRHKGKRPLLIKRHNR